MLGKINQVVKENFNNEVFLNIGFTVKAIEAAKHEACSVIIDVLKSQLDNGKAKDLYNFFQGKKSEHDLLIGLMAKKYANRLNKYHGINIDISRDIAEDIIPQVMKKLVSNTSADVKTDKGIFALFNWLSGKTVNFEEFFIKMNTMQLA